MKWPALFSRQPSRARILPIDPAEERVLDQLRANRAALAAKSASAKGAEQNG